MLTLREECGHQMLCTIHFLGPDTVGRGVQAQARVHNVEICVPEVTMLSHGKGRSNVSAGQQGDGERDNRTWSLSTCDWITLDD